MHAALMTGDAPTINESGVCTAVNYIKVHAFLARGTCLFSPPRGLLSFAIFVSLMYSFYPRAFSSFLAPICCSLLSHFISQSVSFARGCTHN